MLQISVRDLFAAAILPGVMLVGLYILFVLGVVIVAPKMAPSSTETAKNLRALALETLKMTIPPIVLIVLVLGSILAGIVEPTQAAAVGVVGALVLALFNGKLNWDLIRHTSKETVVFCGMVFMILMGANCFTLVFNALGGDMVVLEFFEKQCLFQYLYLILYIFDPLENLIILIRLPNEFYFRHHPFQDY